MMLSGLGPAAELEKHDIETVADLPGVGAHLMDHIVTNTCFKDTSGSSLVVLRPRNAKEFLRSLPHLVRYILMGKGGLTCNVRTLFYCRPAGPLTLCIRSARLLHSFARMTRSFLVTAHQFRKTRHLAHPRPILRCSSRRWGTATMG